MSFRSLPVLQPLEPWGIQTVDLDQSCQSTPCRVTLAPRTAAVSALRPRKQALAAAFQPEAARNELPPVALKPAATRFKPGRPGASSREGRQSHANPSRLRSGDPGFDERGHPCSGSFKPGVTQSEPALVRTGLKALAGRSKLEFPGARLSRDREFPPHLAREPHRPAGGPPWKAGQPPRAPPPPPPEADRPLHAGLQDRHLPCLPTRNSHSFPPRLSRSLVHKGKRVIRL